MMLGLDGARYGSAPRQLMVNGVTFRVVTASVPTDLSSALDQVAAQCSERGGIQGAEDLLERMRTPQAEPYSKWSLLGGVHRVESDHDGVVACVDSGGPLGLLEIPSRVREFLRTGDLSAIGELRYVFGRRSEKGTNLLLLWTEGTAPILEMFPPRGDSPGTDPAGFPRLPNMQRLLSASEAGHPYSITFYRAFPGPSDLAERYRSEFGTRGWTVSEAPSAGNRTTGRAALLAREGDRILLVRFVARSGETIVAVERLG